MTKVKICGMTNEEDVLDAIELGVDYLGFLITEKETPHKIKKERAKEIISKLPGHVSSVVVTASKDISKIISVCKETNPNFVQIASEISAEDLESLRKNLAGIKIIMTVHVTGRDAIEKTREFENHCDFILLDTKVGEKLGGTGKVHDWSIDKEIVAGSSKPVFVAGGLNPNNVAEIVKTVRPYCVDVASGVERHPRRKDFEKMKKFIEAAKAI